MIDSVEWVAEAEERLTTRWLAANDKTAVTQSAHRIEKQLGVDPVNAGESRDEQRRIIFEPLLAVIFQVFESLKVVRVLSVGWSGRSV